jgi:Carboxypeptidase regulatory-like domain
MIASTLLAYLFFFPFAASQTGSGNTATLHGLVLDQNARTIANARVVATSDVDVEETLSDANGNFVFLSLLPGSYRINAIKSGYLSACMGYADSKPAEVSAGLDYRAEITLSTSCK